MTLFVEGKNYRAIGKDCQAVSEVYGTLLMISIVVIGFSGIALIVYSDGGVEKPEHIPHTDLCEIMNIRNSTIEISHCGGDAIDRSAIKIKLSVKIPGEPESKHPEFSGSKLLFDPDDNVFSLGDRIIIDTTKPDNEGENVNITNGADVDFYFLDMASQQVIQKTVLHGNFVKLPDWITPDPYGSILDKSGSLPEEFLPTEVVNESKDGLETRCHWEKNQTSSETFTFGIDQYDLNLENPLKLVLLKIVYDFHDNSIKNKILEINVGGTDWIKVADLSIDSTNDPPFFNITDKVNTTEKLYNLKVRISGEGQANSDNKDGWVDFIGIQVK